MNSLKIYISVIVSFFIIFSILTAENDYETWKKQQQEAMRKFKSAQDKAFVEFLENEWRDFQAFKGEVLDEIPKPEKVPEVKPEKIVTPKAAKIIEEIEIPKTKIKEEVQIKKDREIFVKKEKKININFLGIPLEFTEFGKFNIDVDSSINEKVIADFWYEASNMEYDTLLREISYYRKQMNLNDWGFCLMVNALGNKISHNSRNFSKLFLWFLLIKSGHEAKVGYSGNTIYIMLPSENKIYGVSYLTFDSKRYYLISFDKKIKLTMKIKTYEGRYPDANDLIDLSMKRSPKVNGSIIEKELKFRYGKEQFIIPVKFDKSLTLFFKNYPQTDLEVYFNAPLSEKASLSLISELKPILEGRPELEAVNILLRFVQTAFEYKTDGEQFGKEKSLFSDETLFYPYCDCEDRSVLFSYLVRTLLNLEVIGLDYPGHVATAVKINTNFKGDNVIYKNEKYIICDPTFINANLGKSMPKFKNVKPEIIVMG